MLLKTPALIVIEPCSAHTLMAKTFWFSSTHIGRDSAARSHASNMLASFPGDYDGLMRWPFHKTIFLSVLDQLNPQKKGTNTFAPSEKISFRRLTQDPCPTLKNFNFFPHRQIFSKTENFPLNNTLYFEIKFTDLPDPERATPSTSQP